MTGLRFGRAPALRRAGPRWIAIRIARWAVPAWIGLAAAACATAPAYQRPSAPVPDAYKEQGGPSSPEGIAWSPAQPRDEAGRGWWWRVFSDPVLDGLEEQVSLSNQNVAEAEAQLRVARAALRGARADYFPTATAGVSVTRSRASASRTGAVSGTSPRVGTDYLIPFDLSYEVDLWGRIRRNVQANAALAQASAADLETARLSYQAELAADYFQARGLEAERRLLDETVGDYEKALQLTTNRYDQGVASAVDVAQAQAQLESARTEATDVGLSLTQTEHAMAVLLGRPPGDLAVAPGPEQAAPPAIPATLPSDLLERRPDIASAERRVAASTAGIGVAKAAYFPRLLLDASGGFEGSSVATWLSLPSRFWSLGPSLVETLFDGGKRRAQVEQAEAARDGTVAAYRETVLAALQEVEDNLAALRDLAEESREQDLAVAAARRALTLANNRYNGGVSSYLEVITAQNTALSNERIEVEIRTRRMTASVLLIKALGGDWRLADLPSAGALLSRQAPASPAPPAGPRP